MKFSCEKATLSAGLAMVGRATTHRSLPILANMKISTHQTRVLLETTNLELYVQAYIEATVEEAGCCTLPARLLTDFVNVFDHDTITIDVPEATQQGTIKSSLSEAVMTGMDPTEFPHWPQTKDNELSLVMDTQTFKEMVADVAFSAATDDTRPAFTGICIQVGRNGENKVACAAADSNRLAVHSAVLEGDVPAYTEFVVPAKTLKEVAALLPSSGKVEITITAQKKQILFQTEKVNLASRLMDVRYPDYWQMVPTGYSTRSVVETQQFSPVIKAAALFAQDASHTLTLALKPSSRTMTVSASTDGIGENTSTIDATYSDRIEDFTMLFNVKYIADVLTATNGTPELALELHNAHRPAVLKPVGAKEVFYLVMPMQVKREKQHSGAVTT